MKHYYLITNYNLERYLPDAINSVIAQYADLDIFYKNALILISDDCSKDSSAIATIQNIEAQHKNVKYWIQEENLGVGANKSFLLEQVRDMGLQRTDVVTFLDADDMLAQNCMQLRSDAFEQNLAVDAVGGQLHLVSNDVNSCVVDTFYVDAELAKVANIFECQLYGSNSTFKGEVFLKHNIFPDVPYNDDWMFCTLNKINFTQIPHVTLHYRRHNLNNTNAPIKGFQYEHRKFIRNLQLVDLGIILTEEENLLLDKIGFLVFKQEIKDEHVTFRPDVSMPWFNTLPRGEHLRQIQISFEKFKGKLISKNNIHCVFHAQKLKTFLNAISSQLHRI